MFACQRVVNVWLTEDEHFNPAREARSGERGSDVVRRRLGLPPESELDLLQWEREDAELAPGLEAIER